MNCVFPIPWRGVEMKQVADQFQAAIWIQSNGYKNERTLILFCVLGNFCVQFIFISMLVLFIETNDKKKVQINVCNCRCKWLRLNQSTASTLCGANDVSSHCIWKMCKANGFVQHCGYVHIGYVHWANFNFAISNFHVKNTQIYRKINYCKSMASPFHLIHGKKKSIWTSINLPDLIISTHTNPLWNGAILLKLFA